MNKGVIILNPEDFIGKYVYKREIVALGGKSASVGGRIADYLSHIEITSFEEFPTKCIVRFGDHEILTFQMTPGEKTYPLFVLIGFNYYTYLSLEFDTDVSFTCYGGEFPSAEIREFLTGSNTVVHHRGMWQIYKNGVMGVSPSFESIRKWGE